MVKQTHPEILKSVLLHPFTLGIYLQLSQSLRGYLVLVPLLDSAYHLTGVLLIVLALLGGIVIAGRTDFKHIFLISLWLTLGYVLQGAIVAALTYQQAQLVYQGAAEPFGLWITNESLIASLEAAFLVISFIVGASLRKLLFPGRALAESGPREFE